MQHKTKFSRLVVTLATVFLLPLASEAQTPQAHHQQVRAAIDSGDIQAALAQLKALRATSPELFHANNYDYLLARLQEKSGDPAAASVNYQSAIARNSVLTEYSLWHLARLSRATGDLVHERERLRQLLNTLPQSLLRESAAMRLGQSFLESQDYNAAVSALRPLGESKNRSVAREAQMLLGQTLLKAGKLPEARDVFTRLLMQMADASRPDDVALAAVRALDATENNLAAAGCSQVAAAQVAQLPEAEHLLRGAVYQFNRDFDAARLHYTAVLERFAQKPTVANALYQMGRGFYLQQKYEDALKYFQRVLNEFPESMSARDALGFSAGAYTRLKRTDDAIAAYKLFTEKFPDAPNPERPFLNIIDALHEAGRHAEALEWVKRTRLTFKSPSVSALALFAQARIHLSQGLWEKVIEDTEALAHFADLGGTRVPGGTTQWEVAFLRAYALEQRGMYPLAMEIYLAIPAGRNDYYGQRATERLQALGNESKTGNLIRWHGQALLSDAEKAINSGRAEQGLRLGHMALRLTKDPALRDETLKLLQRAYDALAAYKLPDLKLVPLGRQEVLTVIPEPVIRSTIGEGSAENQQPSHTLLAAELLFLGLYDEAVPEFAAARAESPATNGSKSIPKSAGPGPSLTDIDYTLAVYQLRAGRANQAVRFGEQIWKTIPSDYVLELARRDLVDLLYPLPFRESLLKHAPRRGVDPRFVIAIARQESRFQPDAKSVAAARGLMQFIAATANDVAGELSVRGFRQDDLYNPDTAILFGSQYLAGLFKQFPEQPQAVAASYNGGPDNMARWMARSRSSDPDRYVSEIGFSQTKDYVFKVMTNFWQYQQLYDENLDRK